jgi:hypothetical protein
MTWDQRLLDQARTFTQTLPNTLIKVTEAPARVYRAASAAPVYTSNTTADTDTLPDKVRQDIKGIVRVALDEQKAAIEKLSKTLRNILETSGKNSGELEEAVQAATQTLKDDYSKIISTNTDKAIAYIKGLPEDERPSAADFYGSLWDSMFGFLKLALDAVYSRLSEVIHLFKNVWDVERRMEMEVDRAHEAALFLLK